MHVMGFKKSLMQGMNGMKYNLSKNTEHAKMTQLRSLGIRTDRELEDVRASGLQLTHHSLIDDIIDGFFGDDLLLIVHLGQILGPGPGYQREFILRLTEFATNQSHHFLALFFKI